MPHQWDGSSATDVCRCASVSQCLGNSLGIDPFGRGLPEELGATTGSCARLKHTAMLAFCRLSRRADPKAQMRSTNTESEAAYPTMPGPVLTVAKGGASPKSQDNKPPEFHRWKEHSLNLSMLLKDHGKSCSGACARKRSSKQVANDERNAGNEGHRTPVLTLCHEEQLVTSWMVEHRTRWTRPTANSGKK